MKWLSTSWEARDILHDGDLPFYGHLAGCVAQQQGPLDIVEAAPDGLADLLRGEDDHSIGALGLVIVIHRFAASANQVLQPLCGFLAVTVADIEVAQTQPA